MLVKAATPFEHSTLYALEYCIVKHCVVQVFGGVYWHTDVCTALRLAARAHVWQ
jgi:hypothetical protein